MPPVPVIDLRADTNRSGTVELSDPSEDDHEDVWSTYAGAVFLPNIDDDSGRCSNDFAQSDEELLACNDATDEEVNGPSDLLDLARLNTVPWPEAPGDALGYIDLSPVNAPVRLFKRSGTDYTVFSVMTDRLSATELRNGVEFGLEGTDIIRDAAVWDGQLDVTFLVEAGTWSGSTLPDGQDRVTLRLAPLILASQAWDADIVYAVNAGYDGQSFLTTLVAATSAGAARLTSWDLVYGDPPTTDQWAQDFMEIGSVSMPAPGRLQSMTIALRSPNYADQFGGHRPGGKLACTELRGRDSGCVAQYDPAHDDMMDTLNSFGNLEAIPPYATPAHTRPLGGLLLGSTESFYPDPTLRRLLEAQAVQPVIPIPTEWLLVGHVDETVLFLKAATPRGWTMAVADPAAAIGLLTAAQEAGHGGAILFSGMVWDDGTPAETTIDDVLADPDILQANSDAALRIDEQLALLRAETGVTDAELVRLPVLFAPELGFATALAPNAVNSLAVAGSVVAVAEPHGPIIDGQDLLKQAVDVRLRAAGYVPHWVEDWDVYHAMEGEVHCGTNAHRPLPAGLRWWEIAP